MPATMSQPLSSTQPLKSTTSPPPPCPSPNKVWGWLVPLSKGLKYIQLDQVKLRAGRDPDQCNVLLTCLTFQQKEEVDLRLEKISRVHFCLDKELGEDNAFLTDTSLNGTWVNKVKLGEGKKMTLEHCSIIAVLSLETELFCYLDKNFMERVFPFSLTSKFLVGKVLGEGTTSVVRMGYRRVDMVQVALKMINKKNWPSKYSEPSDLMAEVTVLADLEHPCITKVEEVVETDDLLVIVLEFSKGGELFDQVVEDYKRNRLNEKTAKLQFYQVVDTMRYLHSKHVCHRDLKLENLLLAEPGPHSLVKVSDFGLSKMWGKDTTLLTYVGTPVYMAPEVLSMGERKEMTGYTYKADCWSLGVILFLLLSGKHPFSQGKEMTKCILEGRFRSMTGSVWDNVSYTAKSLVKSLLECDPDKRLSTEQVMEHPWFSQDQGVCVLARGMMAGRKVYKLGDGDRYIKVEENTVKRSKEVPLIDLTEDSEE